MVLRQWSEIEPLLSRLTYRQVDRWLRVGSAGATLVHDEHGAIALPPGDYRVRIQREYRPEAIVQVRD